MPYVFQSKPLLNGFVSISRGHLHCNKWSERSEPLVCQGSFTSDVKSQHKQPYAWSHLKMIITSLRVPKNETLQRDSFMCKSRDSFLMNTCEKNLEHFAPNDKSLPLQCTLTSHLFSRVDEFSKKNQSSKESSVDYPQYVYYSIRSVKKRMNRQHMIRLIHKLT